MTGGCKGKPKKPGLGWAGLASPPQVWGTIIREAVVLEEGGGWHVFHNVIKSLGNCSPVERLYHGALKEFCQEPHSKAPDYAGREFNTTKRIVSCFPPGSNTA